MLTKIVSKVSSIQFQIQQLDTDPYLSNDLKSIHQMLIT